MNGNPEGSELAFFIWLVVCATYLWAWGNIVFRYTPAEFNEGTNVKDWIKNPATHLDRNPLVNKEWAERSIAAREHRTHGH